MSGPGSPYRQSAVPDTVPTGYECAELDVGRLRAEFIFDNGVTIKHVTFEGQSFEDYIRARSTVTRNVDLKKNTFDVDVNYASFNFHTAEYYLEIFVSHSIEKGYFKFDSGGAGVELTLVSAQRFNRAVVLSRETLPVKFYYRTYRSR